MLALTFLVTFQLAAPTDVSRLVAQARTARFQQDSALASYQAVVRQRMSAGIGVARGLVGQVGRPRLAARFESIARVGWHHTRGAWGEILGARSVVPIVGELEPEAEEDDISLVLPYFPGRERLWPVEEMRDAMRESNRPIDHDWIMHPLELGGDSVYTFAIGDSLAFRLPDGTTVRLRELKMRPKRPDARFVVGSLWIDVATGALVRAAYRPSMPMDLWPLFGHELDRGQRGKVQAMGPFLGTIREVIVEHGLYEKRFWLPRTRIANAEGTAKLGRVTVAIEQTFTYEKVTALAPGEVFAYREPEPDIDPRTGRIRRGPWRGVEYPVGTPRGWERTTGTRWGDGCKENRDDQWTGDSILNDRNLVIMYAEGIRIRVLRPCRERELATSPLLPQSIYDPSEDLFTETDFNSLRKDVEGALSIGSQAEWEPQRPTFHYGLERGLLRYNRIEGLSAGARVERVYGNGYTGAAEARLGVADLEPNGELSMSRSNASNDVQFGAYRRLVASNDWGDPLGSGASAVAAVFGRDDGFYYRTLGAEVMGAHRGSVNALPITWRLFVEDQNVAKVETHQSVAHWINEARFPANIQATAGLYAGGAAGLGFALGLDPKGVRLSGALRAEAAGGESSYGRGMLDLTLTRGFGESVLATLTAAGGAAAGELPPQRLWYLGGGYTVRGHRAGSAAGDAFWLGRAELARGHPIVRPTIFADIGWAGARENFATPGRPLSGVGAGASVLDGMLRLDIARGLGANGGGRWRAEFYFEIR